MSYNEMRFGLNTSYGLKVKQQQQQYLPLDANPKDELMVCRVLSRRRGI